MHPPPTVEVEQQHQQQQDLEDTKEDTSQQYILTPSKAMSKKLRDTEKALQVSDERIMELEKRLEIGLKDKTVKDQEVTDLKMREKTFKGSIISVRFFSFTEALLITLTTTQMENTIDGLNAQLSEQAQVLEDYKAKVDAAKGTIFSFFASTPWY